MYHIPRHLLRGKISQRPPYVNKCRRSTNQTLKRDDKLNALTKIIYVCSIREH